MDHKLLWLSYTTTGSIIYRDQLFQKYQPLALALSRKWGQGTEDAKQTAYLVTLETIDDFDLDRGTQFITLLFPRIRKALAMKNTNEYLMPEYIEEVESMTDVESEFLENELHEMIDEYLDSMEWRDHLITVMRYWEDKSWKEIMNGDPQAYKRHEKLKKILRNEKKLRNYLN